MTQDMTNPEVRAMLTAMGDEFAPWGVRAVTDGRTVTFTRGGFARVVVTHVGGGQWVVAWSYDDDVTGEWRAETHDAYEIGQAVHMTVNADCAR